MQGGNSGFDFDGFCRLPSGILVDVLAINFFIMTSKYGKKAQDKVEKVMHERKHGELKSGSGKTVTSRKQAIAIGLSEARKAGGKVPAKKTSTSKK